MVVIWPALALAVVYGVGFCWRDPGWAGSVVKTGSVLLLCAAAWISGGPLLLAMALGLGALGDLALSRPGERAFLIGLSAFLLSHLAYGVLAVTTPGWALSWVLVDPARLWAGLALAVLALGMAWRLWPRAGALRGAVMAYLAVICAMGVTILGLAPGPHWPLAGLAAALFIFSDAVLAAELFLLRVGGRAKRIATFLVWPSYWSAQCLFLLAFA